MLDIPTHFLFLANVLSSHMSISTRLARRRRHVAAMHFRSRAIRLSLTLLPGLGPPDSPTLPFHRAQRLLQQNERSSLTFATSERSACRLCLLGVIDHRARVIGMSAAVY
jgi:hypothetical protein